MPRKTPTLELIQNADIASPVRRSSRIAQHQKPAAPVATRRASADSNTTNSVEIKVRKSRRLSLSQEPAENSESGRSTPVFGNNENKTTRKRKDSASSLNEGKSATPVQRTSTPTARRTTRSMSESPQKYEENSSVPATNSRSRHYSVTEKLKPLESIEEMETVKEALQVEEIEKKGNDKNLKTIKEAVVILNPITNNNTNTKHENNIILEENDAKEPDIQKPESDQIEDKEINNTITFEETGNSNNNKVKNKSPESSATEKVYNESIKSNPDFSTDKDSMCELILPTKNTNIGNNISLAEDQSFQFSLSISIENALKTPEKKGKENESLLLNTSKKKTSSIGTPKSIAAKLKETKTPEQSPKSDKVIENGKQYFLGEPMEVDEYTLLDDLDDDIAGLSKEAKQMTENVCLTSESEKIVEKEDTKSSRYEEKEKFETETAEKVEIKENYLKKITADSSDAVQNEEILKGSPKCRILEKEKDEEVKDSNKKTPKESLKSQITEAERDEELNHINEKTPRKSLRNQISETKINEEINDSIEKTTRRSLRNQTSETERNEEMNHSNEKTLRKPLRNQISEPGDEEINHSNENTPRKSLRNQTSETDRNEEMNHSKEKTPSKSLKNQISEIEINEEMNHSNEKTPRKSLRNQISETERNEEMNHSQEKTPTKSLKNQTSETERNEEMNYSKEKTPSKSLKNQISEIEINDEMNHSNGKTQREPLKSQISQTEKYEEPIHSNESSMSLNMETENDEEMSHKFENNVTNDGSNDSKKTERKKDLVESIPGKNITIDKEKDSKDQTDNSDKKERIHDHVSSFKHETHVASPKFNIDAQLEYKVTELINSKFNANQEKSDSEVDVESVTDYLDDMAEEGEERDESEHDSNEIVDEGESVGFSSSDEKETDDDSFDDSFIDDDDDVSNVLLSGEEYDLGEDNKTTEKIKNKKLQSGTEKWSRIIQAVDSDESEADTAKVDATNSVNTLNEKEQTLFPQANETTISTEQEVVENNLTFNESFKLQSTEVNKPEIVLTSEQAGDTETSPKKTKMRSSLSISENVSFNEIRERIEQVVDLFSSTVNNSNKKIYFNLSLNYESDSDAKENENKLSTSLQNMDSSNKLKKSRRKSSSTSNIFTSIIKPKKIELESETTEQKDSSNLDNDLQPCKSDEVIEEKIRSKKKRRKDKNVEEALLSSTIKSKTKLSEESENTKPIEKIFNEDLAILSPPKKKKRIQSSEETVTFVDNNRKEDSEGDSEIRKKVKRRDVKETIDQENESSTNEVDITVQKKDKKKKKKKMKGKDYLEILDAQIHEKKRKSEFNVENDSNEVDSMKKTKKQKIVPEEAFENTKREKDKVKIISNVLLNTINEKNVDPVKKSKKKKHEIKFNEDNQQCADIEENVKTSTKVKDKKKKKKTEEFTDTLLNINPSNSNPKLWIIDDFDTPPKPSQKRKLKSKTINKSKESFGTATKDFKKMKLHDPSRNNRMETTQLIQKKKKQFDIKNS